MKFGRKSRVAGSTLAMALFATASSFAQRPAFRSFTNTGRLLNGIQVDSLSWNADYFQLAAPAGSLPISQQISLGSAMGFGAGVTLGWYHRTARSDYEIRYSGEYDGFTRHSELGGFGHEMSIGFRRKATPRLQLDFFAYGESTKLSELLLSPTAGTTLAQRATTVTDLSPAISTGTSADVGLNPTDSPLLLSLSPARLETASVAASFVYSATPKLSWFGRAQADRFWYQQDRTGRYDALSVAPAHNEVAGTAGFTYRIRRRTQFGLDLEYNRSGSRYYLANAVDAVMSLTRFLSERWFIGGRGGPGLVTITNVGDARRETRRQEGYAAGVMTGYKGLANTFMFAADRSVTGKFGLGEDYSISGSFVWTWEQRGSPWSLSSSMSYEQLGGGIRRLDAWLLSASAGRRLSQRTVLSAQFVTATNSSPTTGVFDGVVRRSARLSLVWSPSPQGRRRR